MGGFIHDPLSERLKFLYENGKKEQVWMYFRNRVPTDGD